MSISMLPGIFERLVAVALDALPERFRKRLENVEVVIEDAPTGEQRRIWGERRTDEAGDAENETLFGLYEGIPQVARDSGYTFVLPDKITIFRTSILEACETEDEVRYEVQATVLHEIAHHFGISDERLDDLGKY
ncbi:MAG: hypothetical protein A2991_02300 [Candidatus Terrybacteria bacterium RIFCSPLOWO2_01_FULL_58_14]|uniref:Metallopeptidase family protein n=2 Tax=Candidatus Terryibacteriota TaxID=1817920 RepID=A0A1G2Q066_9BACT|nr:MAG: hypothetical protein A2682_00920 [Candidatus Terrybacteria bacterium RIFCSPHIGHO2_01_FULL_58_15]OHA53965.1 MAG: hypothetical protein A2991_02300 [Candidatus Terrybacteria bacterium RIFCSPLOWO2_01_FULL_58_14]